MTSSLKLRFSNPHYYTTTVNGCKTVSCDMSCMMNLPLPFTKRMVKKYKELAVFSCLPIKSNIVPCVVEIDVKGISVCHPEDKFEFPIGKHLSESKAKRKAYDLASRILVDLVKEYTEGKVTRDKKGVEHVTLSPVETTRANAIKLAKFAGDEVKHIELLKSEK